MTKEIKEANAKVKKELKEKRKHFKAVGLKTGEAIEEFFVPQAGGGSDAVPAAVAEGRSPGNDGANSSGDGGLSRKKSSRVPEQGSSSGTIIAKEEPVEDSSSPTIDSLPMKRAWVVSEGGANKAAGGDTASSEPKRGRQDGSSRDSKDGGGGSGGPAKCEYGNCSKTANFGVNGIVRYW